MCLTGHDEGTTIEHVVGDCCGGVGGDLAAPFGASVAAAGGSARGARGGHRIEETTAAARAAGRCRSGGGEAATAALHDGRRRRADARLERLEQRPLHLLRRGGGAVEVESVRFTSANIGVSADTDLLGLASGR